MNIHFNKAKEIIKNGGIVIFPTDTAFGIGCRIDNNDAIQKLFSIRRRPATQAMPVLCASKEMVKQYVTHIPENVEKKIMDKYWPGAVTIILPANLQNVPSLVRGGGISVGVRVPNHEIPRALSTFIGVPILGSSANFHGDPTPYTFADINPQLISLADYSIPGTCSVKKESTVIDCSDEHWNIVRQGAIHLTI